MNDEGLRQQIETLRAEHRNLDRSIEELLHTPDSDQLEIARLKKRKLLLKDQIASLADQIVPDIIA